MNNIEIYNQKNIVDSYRKSRFLFKAEKLIFESLQNELANGTVLDMGIGGGRTTEYLADKCHKYIGIDYAKNMVSACQQSFPNLDLRTLDATNLLGIENESVDICLFSFNGIDCVSLEQRIKILKETHRVLKNGGKFIFSFHNSLAITRIAKIQFPFNPLNWLGELNRYRNIHAKNENIARLQKLDYCYLFDGAENFKSKILYATPKFQFTMLQNNQLSIKHIYEVTSGKQLTYEQALTNKSYWLYLVCEKKAS